MGFMDVVKGIGDVALSVVPHGDKVRGLINAFLPEDEQLGANATGADAERAFANLPPDAQVQINRIAADVEIAKEEGWTERLKAMSAADGQSTRPKIAWALCQVLCAEILLFTVWCFVHPKEMGNAALWTVFAALTATPAGVLAKYFGELRKEQANRLGTLGLKSAPSILGKLFGKG